MCPTLNLAQLQNSFCTLVNDSCFFTCYLSTLRHPPFIWVFPYTYKALHSKVDPSTHIANLLPLVTCLSTIHVQQVCLAMHPSVPKLSQICIGRPCKSSQVHPIRPFESSRSGQSAQLCPNCLSSHNYAQIRLSLSNCPQVHPSVSDGCVLDGVHPTSVSHGCDPQLLMPKGTSTVCHNPQVWATQLRRSVYSPSTQVIKLSIPLSSIMRNACLRTRLPTTTFFAFSYQVPFQASRDASN